MRRFGWNLGPVSILGYLISIGGARGPAWVQPSEFPDHARLYEVSLSLHRRVCQERKSTHGSFVIIRHNWRQLGRVSATAGSCRKPSALPEIGLGAARGC